MEKKQVSNATVNDGKGLYDNEGLCETLLNDLNNLFKHLMNGQYINACTVASFMAQKLINLKKGIKTDMDSLQKNIEELKNMNNSLYEQVTGIPAGDEVEKHGNS